MSNWRVAKSLETLREQVNKAHPKRSKAADGTIGDAAHAKTKSEHNPDQYGIVRALDITHDPKNGVDARALANTLLASHDPRILYIISDHRIGSSYEIGGVGAWKWRAYSGADPHTGHLHISVVPDARADSTKAWAIAPAKAPESHPVLREGSKGTAVKLLQRILGVRQDGVFGPITEAAVRRYQHAAHLVADGIVGPMTWKALHA